MEENKDTTIKDLTVNVMSEAGELVIRQGDAAPALLPRGGERITGTLSVPRLALEKLPRKVAIDMDESGDTILAHSYITVCREKGRMLFVQNTGMPEETGHYVGELTLAHKFKEFGINDPDKRRTTFDLAEVIKMNRKYFDTKEIAMKLVTTLRTFKAKVTKQIEDSDDKRGNTSMIRVQAVESNIPESFFLTLPIFAGYPPQRIAVEISIDAQDYSCALVSPDAADFIEQYTDELIDDELKAIVGLHPDLRIFEV